MSAISSTSTEMNCHAGYIVPILTYCSKAWLPNRTNMYKIENVQIMAAKWSLGNSLQSYKERFISLKLLPLCHYVDLHDLLLFLAITRKKFDILKFFKILEDERTRQHCRGELKIENYRIVKSDENFFHRPKKLYNVAKRIIQKLGGKVNKHTITKAYWHFLTTQFSLTTKCSRRIICRCDNCNIWKKLDN